MSEDTKLPGLPVLRSGIKSVDSWALLVNEHLEVRAGSRGDRANRATTQRDLDALAERVTAASKGTADLDVLVEALLANPRFKEALAKREAGRGSTVPLTSTTRTTPENENRILELERRVRALERGKFTPASTTYGLGFEFVPALNRWRLKSDVGFADSTVGDAALTLYRAFFAPGGQQATLAAQAHQSGASYNAELRIGSPTDPNAWTLNRVVDTVNQTQWRTGAVEARFDGTGRLRREHIGLWFQPSTGFGYEIHDVLSALERRTDALKQHTGYNGPW